MLIDGYVLDKVLLKIKEIVGTEKFHDTIILIDTDDKPPHDVTLKNVVILCYQRWWKTLSATIFSRRILWCISKTQTP